MYVDILCPGELYKNSIISAFSQAKKDFLKESENLQSLLKKRREHILQLSSVFGLIYLYSMFTTLIIIAACLEFAYWKFTDLQNRPKIGNLNKEGAQKPKELHIEQTIN